MCNRLCRGVDFPEPGETVTYCFAIATWHLIDEIEVGVKYPLARETTGAPSQS